MDVFESSDQNLDIWHHPMLDKLIAALYTGNPIQILSQVSAKRTYPFISPFWILAPWWVWHFKTFVNHHHFSIWKKFIMLSANLHLHFFCKLLSLWNFEKSTMNFFQIEKYLLFPELHVERFLIIELTQMQKGLWPKQETKSKKYH